MSGYKWTAADGAAFAALAVVAVAVNLSLALLTDIDALWRWGATVVSSVLAAGAAYAIVSRRVRRRH